MIASEFPPENGGMQEHARGLVESLAVNHMVTVFTSRDAADDTVIPNVTIKRALSWRISPDLRVLERNAVDAWITLNAGLSCYSAGLSAPTFAYVYGNDFTRPWRPHPDHMLRIGRSLFGDGLVRRWRARRIRSGLQSARGIFAISEFSRSLCVQKHGVPKSRIVVVPPGIRDDFFIRNDPALPGADRPLRLVTVSRLAALAERKNVDGVIEAVALLKDEVDVEYTIIGDGDDLPRLRDLADQRGVADHVRFLGAVDTARIVEEFCRSDAFIMAVKPSGSDVEGFGMVFAEAAATGLPSIGANIGGIPEVIKQGVSGLLLDDVSAIGIADGLRRFHRCRRDFDRDAIRERARSFSATHCTDAVVGTIQDMLS